MSNIKINGTTPTVIKRNGSNITKMYYNGTEFSLSQTANYNWYYNTDKTLVVREKISDGSFRWYFNGCTVQYYTPPWDSVPSNLVSFILNGKLTHCTYKYSGTNYSGWIGFWDNTIRIWGEDLTANGSGFVQGAILESTGGSLQTNPWEAPTFDPING